MPSEKRPPVAPPPATLPVPIPSASSLPPRAHPQQPPPPKIVELPPFAGDSITTTPLPLPNAESVANVNNNNNSSSSSAAAATTPRDHSAPSYQIAELPAYTGDSKASSPSPIPSAATIGVVSEKQLLNRQFQPPMVPVIGPTPIEIELQDKQRAEMEHLARTTYAQMAARSSADAVSAAVQQQQQPPQPPQPPVYSVPPPPPDLPASVRDVVLASQPQIMVEQSQSQTTKEPQSHSSQSQTTREPVQQFDDVIESSQFFKWAYKVTNNYNRKKKSSLLKGPELRKKLITHITSSGTCDMCTTEDGRQYIECNASPIRKLIMSMKFVSAHARSVLISLLVLTVLVIVVCYVGVKKRKLVKAKTRTILNKLKNVWKQKMGANKKKKSTHEEEEEYEEEEDDGGQQEDGGGEEYEEEEYEEEEEEQPPPPPPRRRQQQSAAPPPKKMARMTAPPRSSTKSHPYYELPPTATTTTPPSSSSTSAK